MRSVTTRCNLNVSIASLHCGIIVIPGTIFMLDAVTNQQKEDTDKDGSIVHVPTDVGNQILAVREQNEQMKGKVVDHEIWHTC